ncbi:septation ring formation regulator EzrA [Bacillus shivajii]|uniref:septation ring formation regulator EzrA n=1 Tax=Bacillus shivajii TaxID=1983719 RepID=UPI001CFB05D5|nr:septation ring formation regulator EzrA [Bacillus shivajii]UCZ52296.1 septation ring formation regulator EzrA [Bacillus shivajii]
MYAYIIYGLIVVFVCIVVYGAWSRKRIYKQVDRIENKKVQLMNRPVTEELSKIKGLKMSGETEERFEQWRSKWDEIITVQLPNIEEKLFDIEELGNKYRFGKAKSVIISVEKDLERIEKHIDEMVAEVDQLIHSEEQNRENIHKVKDLYDETKKKLWVQKGTLGNASQVIEKNLKCMQDEFTQFEQHMEEGNYFQAKEILVSLESTLNEAVESMDEIPQYLVLVEKELPKQVQELENGLEEMEEDGYVLEHFSFSWQIKEMKRRLFALLPLIESLKLTEVKEPVEAIQNEIDEIYEKLEHEVLSRNFVENEIAELEVLTEQLPHQFQELRTDTETVKLNYRLPEDEDKKQLKMEKQLKDLLSQFSVIKDAAEEKKQSFTSLRKMIQTFREDANAFEIELKEAKEGLNHLRSDERKASDMIGELRNELLTAQKKLHKSNLPGVPESLLYKMDEAEKLLGQASNKLNEIPLSLDDVLNKVNEAKEQVKNCVEKLYATMDDANLAEQVIQYGNRYRSQNNDLNIKLLQAEDKFRQYQYDEALEIALHAVEPVDPDVLKKVTGKKELQETY